MKKAKITLIPAIDILGGKCVRLEQGDYSRETVYSDDPVSQALKWRDEGAEIIHIVDLDGAKKGLPVNIGIIEKMIKAVGIPCEIGGGIRTCETATKFAEIGAARVIFGTAAIQDPDIIQKFLQGHPEKTVLGIDAKNGMVAVKGWLELHSVTVKELSAKFAEMGVIRFIYTDIATDGMLAGPNYKEISDFCDNVPTAAVIASGGISSVENIIELGRLGKSNLEGAIVGKALYSGKIRLKEAIEKLSQ